LVAGEPIPPNPEVSTSFPEIPDIERIQELFAVDIDENDPQWAGFDIKRSSETVGKWISPD
jgi:hypothetical protein